MLLCARAGSMVVFNRRSRKGLKSNQWFRVEYASNARLIYTFSTSVTFFSWGNIHEKDFVYCSTSKPPYGSKTRSSAFLDVTQKQTLSGKYDPASRG